MATNNTTTSDFQLPNNIATQSWWSAQYSSQPHNYQISKLKLPPYAYLLLPKAAASVLFSLFRAKHIFENSPCLRQHHIILNSNTNYIALHSESYRFEKHPSPCVHFTPIRNPLAATPTAPARLNNRRSGARSARFYSPQTLNFIQSLS